MLWVVNDVAGANHTTLVVVGIDDSKLYRFTVKNDVPFVITVDDKIETPARFVVTMFIV